MTRRLIRIPYPNRLKSMALEQGIEFHILHFQEEEATLRRRVVDRSLARNDESDADLAVLQRQLAEQEPLTESELKLVESVNNASGNSNTSCIEPILIARHPKASIK